MEKFRGLRKIFAVIGIIGAVYAALYLNLECLNRISNNILIITGIVAVLLFIAAIAFSVTSKRVKINEILFQFGYNLITLFALTAVAFGLSQFKVENEVVSKAILFGYCLIALVVIVGIYLSSRKRWRVKLASSSVRKSAASSAEFKFIFTDLYSALLLLLLSYGATYFLKYTSPLLLVPFCLTMVSLLLWKVLKWRGWILLAIITSVLYMVNFYLLADMTFNVHAIADFVIVVILNGIVLVPLFDLYTRKEENI